MDGAPPLPFLSPVEVVVSILTDAGRVSRLYQISGVQRALAILTDKAHILIEGWEVMAPGKTPCALTSLSPECP